MTSPPWFSDSTLARRAPLQHQRGLVDSSDAASCDKKERQWIAPKFDFSIQIHLSFSPALERDFRN